MYIFYTYSVYDLDSGGKVSLAQYRRTILWTRGQKKAQPIISLWKWAVSFSIDLMR